MAPLIRKTLTYMRGYFVANVTSKPLTDSLLENNWISIEESEEIESLVLTKSDRNRKLFGILITKSDTIIDFLLDFYSISEGQHDVRDKLSEALAWAKKELGQNLPSQDRNENSASANTDETDNILLAISNAIEVEYEGTARLVSAKSEDQVDSTPGLLGELKIATLYNGGMKENEDGTEDIKHRRDGSEVDFENMSKFLKELGYLIFKDGHKNLMKYSSSDTSRELEAVVEEFKAEFFRSEYMHVDSCAVVIMTHGSNKKGHLLMTDRKEVDLDKIINEFSNEKFRRFRGKPKLFFVQACRSEPEEDNFSVDTYSPKEMDVSDLYILHSTVPLAFAYRSDVNGSPFLYCLINVYKEHAHNHHILELQTKVHASMDQFFRNHKVRQMSNADDRGLLKKLYLNPGLGY